MLSGTYGAETEQEEGTELPLFISNCHDPDLGRRRTNGITSGTVLRNGTGDDGLLQNCPSS